MQFWKRITTFSLVITAGLISVFWISAFTTKEVSHLESRETTSVATLSATPIGFSKNSAIKKVNKITLHNGRNDGACLPTISHKPVSSYPVRWYTL